jgi:roadblock/LC7 domain-containing protein
MASLDQLMALPGALAAFEFRGSGELLGHKSSDAEVLTAEVLDMLAHMCAANVSIATMQARGWENMTQLKGYYPVREFTLLGLEWSVVVSGLQREAPKAEGKDYLPPFLGVVLNNTTADYEATYKALEG